MKKIRFKSNVSDGLKLVFEETIKKLGDSLFDVYKPKDIIEIGVNGIIPPNENMLTFLIWKDEYTEQVITPENLPRISFGQSRDHECILFDIDFIDKRIGGMGSWFGYNGYYLSVIFDPEKQEILDVRGERAF